MSLPSATDLPSIGNRKGKATNCRHAASLCDAISEKRQDTPSEPVNEGQSFAGREYEKVGNLIQLYLKDIRALPQINAQEEVRLGWQLWRARVEYEKHPSERCACIIQAAENARTRLTVAFLALVVSIARKYQHRGLELPDLIQEGSIGLIYAVEGFDVTKDRRFSTYATWWIKKYILKAIAEQSRLIRLPEKVHLKAQRLRRERARITQDLGKEPTMKDLEALLRLDVEQMHTLLVFSQEPLSLSESSQQNEDGMTFAGASPLAALNQQLLSEYLVQALKTLSYRAQTILALRFGLVDGKIYPRNVIGKWLGISAERVRQVEDKALKDLQSLAPVVSLREFLE